MFFELWLSIIGLVTLGQRKDDSQRWIQLAVSIGSIISNISKSVLQLQFTVFQACSLGTGTQSEERSGFYEWTMRLYRNIKIIKLLLLTNLQIFNSPHSVLEGDLNKNNSSDNETWQNVTQKPSRKHFCAHPSLRSKEIGPTAQISR